MMDWACLVDWSQIVDLLQIYKDQTTRNFAHKNHFFTCRKLSKEEIVTSARAQTAASLAPR